MRSKALVVLVVLLQAAVVFAWTEPKDFMGLKFGSSIEEMKEKYADNPPDFSMDDLPRIKTFSLWRRTIGEVLVVDLVLGFLDDKFSYARMTYRSDAFDIVKDGFFTRYGSPHSRQSTPMRNGFGASFLNQTYSWNGPTITITIQKYADRSDEGRADISTKKFLQEYDKAERARRKGLAKDL